MNNVKEILERVYKIIGENGVLTKKNIKGTISPKELVYLARLNYIKKDGLMSPNYILCDPMGLYEFGLKHMKDKENYLGRKCLERAYRMGFKDAGYQLFLDSIINEDYGEACWFLRKLLENSTGEERVLYNFYLFLLSGVTVLPDDLISKVKCLSLQDISVTYDEDTAIGEIRRKIYTCTFERNFSSARRNFYKLVRRQAIKPDEGAILELLKRNFVCDKNDEEILQENARIEFYDVIKSYLNKRSRQRVLGIKERCILQLIDALESEKIASVSSDVENFFEAIEAKDYKKANMIMAKESLCNPKKNLSSVEILLGKVLNRIEEKSFNDEERAYSKGIDALYKRDFFVAFKCFHECLEVSPNHSLANYAAFAEYVDKNLFEKAFTYLKVAYENGTDAERKEYVEAIYLMNYLIDMPEEYELVAKTYTFDEESEIGVLYANRNFKDAQKLLIKSTGVILTVDRMAKVALYRALDKQLSKDKETVITLSLESNFVAIVEFLEMLDAKRGLDKYERYMLFIARDILAVKETKAIPLTVSHPTTFETALDMNDYEGALEATDKDKYFNNVLWAPVIALLKQISAVYKEIALNKSYIQLFEDGERYWENGNFFKAEICYQKVHELNPDYRPAIKKLFIYGIFTKRFDMALQYLEKLGVFTNKKEENEYNIFLYLLNHVTVLPDNLRAKAKKLSFQDMGELAQANDSTSSLMYNVVVAILGKKFIHARSLLKNQELNRKLTETETALMILLAEADIIQRAEKAKLMVLLNENKIDEFIKLSAEIDDKYGLNKSMEASFAIAKEIALIKRTGRVPSVIKKDSLTIFQAIENHDYEQAERFNSEYLESYSRYDELLGCSIKKLLEIVREIKDSVYDGPKEASRTDSIDSNAQSVYERGKESYRTGRFYEAFCDFRKCLEINPNHKGAAFEMFCQCCDLLAYNKALEYYRIMIQTETIEEHLENGIYLYLLNYLIDLPEDLKPRLEDVSIDNIELKGIQTPKIYYAKAYIACLKKNFKHAMGIMKDLVILNGFNSRVSVLYRLFGEVQTYYDAFERKLLNNLKEKDYVGALQILEDMEEKWPLNVMERAIKSLIQDIIVIKNTNEVPVKGSHNCISVFAAIFNKDYSAAYRINKSFSLTGNTNEILDILLDDIISCITTIKKGFSSEPDLTQEEKISIEDMCGSGLVPDMISTIKKGVSIEESLRMYAANNEERYIVYIMLADSFINEGNFDAARNCLASIDEVGARRDLLGKYYRYVEATGKKSKNIIISKKETQGE